MKKNINLIGIIGPTATGKTELAVNVACELQSEIISADSRQVYKGMDLGTGKDLAEYNIKQQFIPYHLIDIHEAGYEYNIYEYQKDFFRIFQDLLKKNKLPILCGGSGLYLESVLNEYELLQVPLNQNLRDFLEKKEDQELKDIFLSYPTTSLKTTNLYRKRLIRAIEIADYYKHNKTTQPSFPKINPLLFGIMFTPKDLRKRITIRLKERFAQGMIEEVKSLLQNGVKVEQLEYYGLEYKFIVQYILGKQGKFNDMFQRLNSAIHQFAKRQRTWFRRMEKQGFEIIWLDGNSSLKEKLLLVETELLKNNIYLK